MTQAIKAPDGTTVDESCLCDHQIQHVRVRLSDSKDTRGHRVSWARHGGGPEPVGWYIYRGVRSDGCYDVIGIGVLSCATTRGRISAKCREDWLARDVAIEIDREIVIAP